jgi:hypothetical protein
MNGLTDTIERKVGLSHATPQRHTTLRAAAQSLSLRNVDGAICELMNEALARLVLLLFETDAGGYCNMDGVTGRILVPVPFGRNGYARWGLRPQEANILRQILFNWEKDLPSLLRYDKSRRAWFVCLGDFDNVGDAKGWLRQHQVTIGVYRAARAKRIAGA